MHETGNSMRVRGKAIAIAVPALVALAVLIIALILDDPSLDSWRVATDLMQGAKVTSSFTSGIMIVAGPLLVLWAASLYIRCTDLSLRKYFAWIVVLCILWLLDVLIKYINVSDLVSSLLWYFYYVPTGFIALLCFLIALHVAFYRESPIIRGIRVTCAVITIALIVLVLTNNVHHWVFVFDFSNPYWSGDYSYSWGYWLFAAWTIGLYVMFFGLLIRIAHLRLRRLFVPVVLVGVLAFVYAILYILRIGNFLASNFSLTFIIMLVACIELMFRFGLLPSFSKYQEAFDGLPFDAKILTRDLVVSSETKNAAPLPRDIEFTLEEFVASGEKSMSFRTSAHSDYSYELLRQRGSIALFTENRSTINSQRKGIESALEATRAHIAVLENSVAVESELYRLASERELLDAIDDHLGSTVDVIHGLLDSMSERMSAEERRHTLTFIRLLVGYCKRMGGFVLADANKESFDPERLSLVLGDTAADARASGISCASLVGTSASLPKRSVLVLYNCMYDILIIAFQHAEATVMFSVADRDEESVEFSAVLEIAGEKEIVGSETAEQLRASLSGYDLPYSLVAEDEVLRVSVLLPSQGSGEGGEA